MGNTFANLFKGFFGKKEMSLLMVGPDAAGKTTILYQLKLGEIVTPIPTIGFDVGTLEHKNISFAVGAVGGLCGATASRTRNVSSLGVTATRERCE